MECLGPVGWLYMCEMDIGHFANSNLSVAVVRCWYSGCVAHGKTSKKFSLYRNHDLDDRIYDCLLTTITAVQAADVRASFLFVGDLNGHHLEWLDYTTTALDFATVSGCDQNRD